MKEKTAFSFGQNWDEFIRKGFNAERLSIAKRCLLDFLGLYSFENLCFLDVGCGSGMSSLAALDLGASKIISFDIDPISVKTTRKLKELRKNPSNWSVLSGSILDKEFISQIEPADIVYSWGVLHHTGHMWKAIENTASLLKPNGLMYIALYVTTPISEYWTKIKKKYNKSSPIGKKYLEYWYVLRYILVYMAKMKNPFSYMASYKQKRGMSYFTDVKDWLGGYPYECAKIEEVLQYCREELDLELINIKTGEANIEYLFIRKE